VLVFDNQAIEHFFRVSISSSKHERGSENSRQVSIPETHGQGVCITFKNSPNPTGYVRLLGYVRTHKVL